jgi:hypothetical protein
MIGKLVDALLADHGRSMSVRRSFLQRPTAGCTMTSAQALQARCTPIERPRLACRGAERNIGGHARREPDGCIRCRQGASGAFNGAYIESARRR